MNVVLPEATKLKKKQIIIYIIIVFFCVLAIILAVYVQFYTEINLAELASTTRNGGLAGKTDEESQLLKAEFDKLFINKLENSEEQNNISKKIEDKNLVFTLIEKKGTKLNSYDIELYIPVININNEIIEKYNKEIESVFISKAKSILESENENIIYTVEYVSNIQNGILSLMIRSNLKEGSSAQRVIIKTYNYDLKNNKEMLLEDVLQRNKIDSSVVQTKISNEIDQEQKKVEDLKKLGYNIYNRDTSNDMYKLEKTKEFYFIEDTLYIMYAYGNETFTSEMDLIVI